MSMNDFVVDALTRSRQFKGDHFWTVENHEKYSTLKPQTDGCGHRDINQQIFMLMCALNQQGISDESLCSDPMGRGSLKSVIDELRNKVSGLCRNAHVHYVELGPEPVKTTRILDSISNASSHLRYTAIDINEMSRSTMHDAVVPILTSDGSFNYIAADYHTVVRDDLNQGQDITLITMLGFQEGNELPVRTGRLIRNLSGESTYIISEMQLYKEGLQNNIHAFYANPNMVKFSELVAQQQGFLPTGKHKTTIVRLRILDELLHVAVTLQPVERRGCDGYLITNVCMKYTAEQFRRIRAVHGNCRVIDEYMSGDGTVLYQVAEYRH